MADIFSDYAGLILVAASAYRYSKEATANDLSNSMDFSKSNSVLGQYLYYLKSASNYQSSLFTSQEISYFQSQYLAALKIKDFKSTIFNTLFTTDYSDTSKMKTTFDDFKANDIFPDLITSKTVNYSFNVNYNNIFKLKLAFNFDYNSYPANKVYFDNLSPTLTL